MEKEFIAGNKGKGVRSDCSVTFSPAVSGGIDLKLQSKVAVMYGDQIRAQVFEILAHFGVLHAGVTIEDSGALPFVIAARLEAAIKMALPSEKEYLTPQLANNCYQSARDKYRFSRLYLPGNTPSLMINAGLHKPDGIILDLEDAVAPAKKTEARYLVRNALRSLDFYGAEKMVRINQIPAGLDDLSFVIPHHVNLILVPKCEFVWQIAAVNDKIKEIQEAAGLTYPVWLMPIIESATGVVNCYEIARAADNIVAMAIGLEDLTADLGTSRTVEGTETFFARSKVVIACRAAGIQPIDSVFSDVADQEGLRLNALRSKTLGFDGMGCIHPRQIKVIHEAFGPDEKEIEKAKKIVLAFHEATQKGLGVVSLGTKMIDPPVVKRAQRTIALATGMQLLAENWMEEALNEKI
ncbi:MAG TPA: aldolase/citrate lyase family protein [Bacteroidales bacterium]|nr:aldolase/citrate lyase family protein [Bacteroidales bacterium]HSA44082.1 aldolase/citrate lyase family protein [Bacteroidales bacterium]